MIYQITSRVVSSYLLAEDGVRNEIGKNRFAMSDFFVINAGTANTWYSPKLARFNPNSKMKVLKARAVPLLAKGLREGLNVNAGLQPAFRANMIGPKGEFYTLFLSKFDDWQSCDTVFEAFENPGQFDYQSLTLHSFECVYDSLGIRKEYVGKPFGFCLDLLVDSSGGLVE